MLQEKFDGYWDNTQSEDLPQSVQLETSTDINVALSTNVAANTQNVFVNMFESKVVRPYDGQIEFREQNPDKYFVYLGPNGEVPGVVNINVRNAKTDKHIGWVNAEGEFIKDEKMPKTESVIPALLLCKANGKFAAWPVSILKTNPKLFVLELNAYLFT